MSKRTAAQKPKVSLPGSDNHNSAKQVKSDQKTSIDRGKKEDNSFFEEIVESSLYGVFLSDEEGNFEYVNERATQLLNISRGNLIKMCIKDLFYEEDLVETPLSFDKLETGKHKITFRRIKPSNKNPFIAEIISTKLVSGKLLALLKKIDKTQDFSKESASLDITTYDVVKFIPSGLFLYRFNEPDKLRLITGNKAAEKLTGIKVSEWKGKEFDEIWPNAKTKGFTDLCFEVIKTRKSKVLDNFHYSDNRLSKTFRVHIFVTPENLLGIAFENITSLIQTEKDLVQSQERFTLAIQAAKDGLFDWNIETNEVFFSPRWKSMLGYEDHEILNKLSEWERLTHKSDVKKARKLLERLMNGQADRYDIEFRMKHKEGHWVDVHSRADLIKDRNGKMVRLIGTHTDITQRKIQTKKLASSEEKFRNMVELSPNGMIFLNNKGYIEDVNQAFERMTGFKSKEVIGLHFLKNPTFISSDIQSFAKIFKKLILGQLKDEPIEFRWRDKKGDIRFGEARIGRLTEGGKTKGLQAIVSDITKRKENEEIQKLYQKELQDAVNNRTKELQDKNNELERINNLFVGREFRIKELRSRVYELEEKLRKLEKND